MQTSPSNTPTAAAVEEPASEEAPSDIQQRLRELVAKTLGISPEEIDVTQPLTRYGVDSVKALELELELETAFGVSQSTVNFIAAPSISELTTQLLAGWRALRVEIREAVPS